MFHIHFGGLYDSTWLECCGTAMKTKKNGSNNKTAPLCASLKVRIEKFLQADVDPNDLESLRASAREAIEIHSMYEEVLARAGFRKVTMTFLKDAEKWRQNI